MFGNQTPSNIVWWPNILMLKWVAKRLEHVWSNTDEAIDSSRWVSVVRMPTSNTFDTRLSNEQKIAHQTRVQKKCFKLLLECLMTVKFYQTRPNTIKHIQTGQYSTKRGVQTVKCLVTKQCLMVFDCHTFIVCPGPKPCSYCDKTRLGISLL